MFVPPRAAASAAPARWVQERYVWGGNWVTREVGPDFEAYVRVLHPPVESSGAETWAEVAAAHDKVMHPAVQWDEITVDGPWDPARRYDANRNGGVGLQGELPTALLSVVCRVLRRHTSTADSCFFAVWDGWGWDNSVSLTFTLDDGEPAVAAPTPDPAFDLDRNAPKFSVPHRDFLLYAGRVEQAASIGGGGFHPGSGFVWEQGPTLMWPEDHAWCLSSEIDAEYTVIGCTSDAAYELTTTPGVEAVVVSPDAPWASELNQEI